MLCAVKGSLTTVRISQQCVHTCVPPCGASLTTRGGSFKTHTSNNKLHPGCNNSCEGWSLLETREENTASASQQEEAQREKNEVPLIPLNILWVLPSDFDEPVTITQDRVFETTIHFSLCHLSKNEIENKIPGFLENSLHCSKTDRLQINSWVGCFVSSKKHPLTWLSYEGAAVLLPCKWR
jgi:hypothetical protein